MERSPRGREGKRRGALSAEAITETAIRIADAEGLDAVSIRRVAAELDARPMSIYDHIPSKDDLFAEMSNEVIAGMLSGKPLPHHWRGALSKIARRLYALLVGHPWLVFILPKYPRFGPNATMQAEQLATAMAGLGLEPDQIWTLAGTMNDFVLGHSLRVVTAPQGVDLDEAIPPGDVVEEELAALPAWLRTRSTMERFESGLKILLDGIEAQLPDPPPPPDDR